MRLGQVKIIGIHGPLNGGKDTVANYIQQKYSEKYSRYAFAKPLKEACKVMFGFSNDQLEDRVLKEAVDPYWGFTPRKAMQKLGTEFGRDMMRDDVWIKRAELEIANNLKIGKGTIITDVRFENEAIWLRDQPYAVLIYIKVPGLEKDERYNHASEAGISQKDSDIVIVNDKSKGLQELYNNIDKMLGRRSITRGKEIQ